MAIKDLGLTRLVALGGTAALCDAAADLAAGRDTGVPPPPPSLGVSDAEDLTLPDSACAWVQEITDIPQPLTMVNGEVSGFPDGFGGIGIERFAPVLVTDVDGDGGDDLVVPIYCTAGGSGYTNEIYAYSAGGLLGEIAVGQGVDPYWEFTIHTMSVDQGIRVSYVAGFDDEPLCCGTRAVLDRWIYQEGQFVLPERSIVDPESHSRELIGAVNDGNREAALRFTSAEVVDYLIAYRPWSLQTCYFQFINDEPSRACPIIDVTGYSETLGWVRTGFTTWFGGLLYQDAYELHADLNASYRSSTSSGSGWSVPRVGRVIR